ncbi:MAG: radical SAM protein [Bdellovibrionales bacterium RIFOXYC1_FULL_54_43]|nr:MAG: radical SAM protein [Bdellovibrionales bacterium RIFOXYC1_FULL_54_43]OFZ81438.1 MAG: radical SAM protein [Bdellovibrionales bacterium RIFOXYD1_FULL_55_31]
MCPPSQQPFRLAFVIPPMTQLNTPYPSTAQLAGFLRSRLDGRELAIFQVDLALELALSLFSRKGLEAIRVELERLRVRSRGITGLFLSQFERYSESIDPVMRFLQGKDPTLAYRIASRDFLPEGPRFDAVGPDSASWAFGMLSVQDRAKHFATLFLDELVDVVRNSIDPRFELARYGEKLAASNPRFEPLRLALDGDATLVDRMLDEITERSVARLAPDAVAITAPFAGNVYGAFRVARALKRSRPETKLILGGGYVNTELRELSEPRVFDYFDFVTLDDGEMPLLCLLEHLRGMRSREELFRTFVRENGTVVLKENRSIPDIPHDVLGLPDYATLPMERYFSVLEMLNPMHRIWSDGRWNKLAVAHGCYWKKCSFCDVSLDYICRYDSSSVDVVIDRMESLIAQSGQTGFHFVDEAAPPAFLRKLAERLLERKLVVSWWGNIRFETAFTPHLARLLAQSGCIAVTGGLEVASDRLLKLMRKGVTVEQVARVTRGFADAGVLVHAYLMYGFPTQTEQETVDSLERVRQLFESGCIQSAFWHRFSATIHSPVGRNPEKFGITLVDAASGEEPLFARNDVQFEDPTGCKGEVTEVLGEGLRKAVYNYMQGAGLDLDVRFWFERKVPKAKVPKRLIARALGSLR